MVLLAFGLSNFLYLLLTIWVVVNKKQNKFMLLFKIDQDAVESFALYAGTPKLG